MDDNRLLAARAATSTRSARTTPFDCEIWDAGRLHVHRPFASLLRANGLTTCGAFLEFDRGEPVRRVGSRETLRIALDGTEGTNVLYLKRHGPPRWRDRIMPLLHLSRPIHGARNEWEAIRRFAEAGIPTMTPVAFGEIGASSFVVTQALPVRCNLLEFVGGRGDDDDHRKERAGGRSTQVDHDTGGHSPPCGPGDLSDLIVQVAGITRRMHECGLHHQDYYLNHLLLCDAGGTLDVRVIDLGRVRQRQRLATRWIIKDLAQLDFSARRLPCRDRLRFLRLYLGRPFTARDRRLVRRVSFKSQRIAGHTAKHDL